MTHELIRRLYTKWPLKVSSYGRRYYVSNADELLQLLAWLDIKELRLANRYRVGSSWPRGSRERTIPDA